MISWDCATDPNSGEIAMFPIDTSCITLVGGTYSNATARVTLPNGYSFPFSMTYQQLWSYENPGIPYPSGGITDAQAEAWLKDFITRSFIPGTTYSNVTASSQTYNGGQSTLCHKKLPYPCSGNGSGNVLDAGRFSGYIKFPDGTKCPVNYVSFDDQAGTDICQNSYYGLSIKKGSCPECN